MNMGKLVASEGYERTKRIIVHTEGGRISFCTPINCERVAVVESFFGMTLYIGHDDLMLKHILDGKKYVMIEHPVEGQAYLVQEIACTYAAGTHIFTNDIYTPDRFMERAGQQIDVAVIQGRVIIDLYNMTADTLAFSTRNSLTVTADSEATAPRDLCVKLEGSHTEVECDDLAQLLIPHAELYGHHTVKGELEHFYSITLCESGEKGSFAAVRV